ncbi:EAL domain-containing protein [uncultured Desulfuromonas sp.]|uniref:EAL domain-containing protein n=1 Tax=uncultured Desulfuromonas sp. TaxID=181013 RepID=UPI0026281F25|nr:EAL domain-containing protein [uncultured Desulfuromonas sp.]
MTEAAKTSPIQILLVEDSQTHAAVIGTAFETEAHRMRLTVVRSLAEARNHIAETPPDLAIVDLLLPDGRGSQLLAACQGQNAAFPMVILTGNGDEEAAVEAMKSGALDYVVKSPATLEEMPRIVDRSLREWDHITERRRAEKSLQESEARFRLLYERAPLGFQSLDDEGRIVDVNQTWLEDLGYAREEVLGRNFWDFLAPEQREPFLASYSRYKALGSNEVSDRDAEFALVRKDGKPVLMNFECRVERDEQGLFKQTHCILADISERKKAEQALARERSFLQSVINGVIDPIMVIDLDYQVLMMNRAAHDMLPDPRQDERLTCHKVSHHSDRPCSGADHVCPLEEVRRTGKPVTVVHEHLMADGERRFFELEASPLWTPEGVLRGIIESSRDITDRLNVEARLTENEKRLHHLAHHDPLTGLPNRLLFTDRLNQAMAKARRSGTQVALLFLDLDRFKKINDSLGHDIGDRLLRDVAIRLRDCVREIDTVARMGGDEFLVILEQVEEIKDVALVAEKILFELQQVFPVDDYRFHVTASIGIAVFPDNSPDVDGLLRCADVAMYRAKDEGRDRYQFFTPDMNSRARDYLLLEGSLRQALQEKQFLLHYQPQIDMTSGELIGMEALVRWEHPERGTVPPGDFIPLAEETGLIVPIGDWVLRTACAQNKAWQDKGMAPMRMAVNISGQQFRQPDFVDTVKRILEETGLDPEWLELEITESIVMENVGQTILTLTDLKVRDIHLSIDDFGTGYSSLNYLKRFPISKLKIDRSFVRDVHTDPNDAAICTAIIALGLSMDLDVVAEGVETEGQAEFLRTKGCIQGQGYLFGRPGPPETISRHLTDQPSPCP